ncbi:MAG: DEAD/DEAH box helicase [Nannocystis sp.]|nr:DEAD/DEAH box helicase [Nannocystis sp.]
MPFERWVREYGPHHQGALNLILSNPPYGERGAMAREDPDEVFKEKRAFAYFMRRTLDLLVPSGIGVFLIPAGFMSGRSSRGLREKILLRHHLLGAYRLPSHDTNGREIVPGAFVVMDIVIWRSRGGELREVDADDIYILDGEYFEQHPDQILGDEEGSFAGEDEAGNKKTSWRYKVEGDFRGLPPLQPRPICTSCELTSIAPRAAAGTFQTVVADVSLPNDLDPELRAALELGRRVGRYLAALGADDDTKALALWPELHQALTDHALAYGNPWQHKELLALSNRGQALAQQLLNAYTRMGALVPALRDRPKVEPKYTGQPDDVPAQAEMLFRARRHLTITELLDFHRRQGGTLSRQAALESLFGNGWNLDGDEWNDLYPSDAYTTGIHLWERHDRAQARAAAGDAQAAAQVARLIAAIKPVLFQDIQDIGPNQGWVPLELVAAWLSATYNRNYGPILLERHEALVRPIGPDGDKEPTIHPKTSSILGWINHDMASFKVEKPKKRDSMMSREEKKAEKLSLAQLRLAQEKAWTDEFVTWLTEDEERQEAVAAAYNRAARGRVVPTYTTEPLEIARWGANAPQLKPHQVAGARRVLHQRGGLVAFDVGVGKTYTALAIVALARQEGWSRRPVILVPGSIVWKWHDDILCTLPDYRIAVIGSKRKRLTRGTRKGQITSETDTPEERAQKWIALQTGQLDVVILSYDALGRTKMNESAVLEYVESVEAIRRSLTLRRTRLNALEDKAKEKLSERQKALLEHGTSAWVDEILALPEGWQYDPGVTWDEIGVDLLIVDEAASFKNLHLPQAREDGSIPKFMGSGGGEGSGRAWQLDFRAGAVRRQTGGSGVVLLTATPAKNSPLEFYNLIQFIDPAAFTRAGIYDPEQFITRFIQIAIREVLDSTLNMTEATAVVGFKNLDDLRTIIFTYGEFRTAEEVGLKLPRPIVETLTVQMDDEQEAKYRVYVRQIEEALENPNPDGPSNLILGLLARLALVALHPALDEGYSFRTALAGGESKRTNEKGEEYTVRLPRPSYSSPKLEECARRVVASPHCGHIIFVEPTAVHVWMKEVLVDAGIPRERIAWLNSDVSTIERSTIARQFNGLSAEQPEPGTCSRPSDSAVAPKYDVIIANSVAYEGIDLQVRTCSIHHLDLPWTPADLEQRNGRGVRQGNTLGVINIYYYFADGSSDGYRFSLIDGKANWLGQLIKSSVRDTNNPSAQQQLTPEDIMLMVSRDKERTAALLEGKRKRALEERRAKIAREAARLLRQAVARYARARASDDPDYAAQLRDEAKQRLTDLQGVDRDAWPWQDWMWAAREHDMLVPENGAAPLYEGLRVARPRIGAPDQLEHLEFGRISATGDKIAVRAAGSAVWSELSEVVPPLTPDHLPREGGPRWPDDDDQRTSDAIALRLNRFMRDLDDLGWIGASDAFVEKFWPRFERQITATLARNGAKDLPLIKAGVLALGEANDQDGSTILPPSLAGWRRYLELAPTSGLTFTELKQVGDAWWMRPFPRGLLTDARRAGEAEDAEDAAPSTASLKPPKPPTATPKPPTAPPEAPRSTQPTQPATPPPPPTSEAAEAAIVASLTAALTRTLREARAGGPQ